MKKLSKIVCLLLATLILVLPLSACSDEKSSTTTSTTETEEGGDDVVVSSGTKGDKTSSGNKNNSSNKENSSKPLVSLDPTESKTSSEVDAIKAKYGKTDLGGEKIIFAAPWNHGPGKSGTSKSNTLRQSRIKSLEKKHNCKFEFIVDSNTERLKTSVAAKKPYVDFFCLYTSNLPSFAFNGYLQDMKKIETVDLTEEKWVVGHVDNGNFNGGYYAFSIEQSSQPRFVLAFNKTMFKKNGWTLPYEYYNNDTWTWENCLELAKKATDHNAERFGLGGMELAGSSITASFGGEFVKTNSSGAPTFVGDSEECRLANEFNENVIKKQYKDYIWSPESYTWTTSIIGLRDGKVAMAITQLYMIRENITGMEDDYGIVPIPKGSNKNGTYCSIQEDVPTTVMLANNPKANEKCYILNQYNEPYEKYDMIVARTEMETYCRDDESVECLLDLQNYYGKFNRGIWFSAASAEYSKAIGEVNSGKATFAQAMAKYKSAIVNKLNETYKSWNE